MPLISQKGWEDFVNTLQAAGEQSKKVLEEIKEQKTRRIGHLQNLLKDEKLLKNPLFFLKEFMPRVDEERKKAEELNAKELAKILEKKKEKISKDIHQREEFIEEAHRSLNRLQGIKNPFEFRHELIEQINRLTEKFPHTALAKEYKKGKPKAYSRLLEYEKAESLLMYLLYTISNSDHDRMVRPLILRSLLEEGKKIAEHKGMAVFKEERGKPGELNQVLIFLDKRNKARSIKAFKELNFELGARWLEEINREKEPFRSDMADAIPRFLATKLAMMEGKESAEGDLEALLKKLVGDAAKELKEQLEKEELIAGTTRDMKEIREAVKKEIEKAEEEFKEKEELARTTYNEVIRDAEGFAAMGDILTRPVEEWEEVKKQKEAWVKFELELYEKEKKWSERALQLLTDIEKADPQKDALLQQHYPTLSQIARHYRQAWTQLKQAAQKQPEITRRVREEYEEGAKAAGILPNQMRIEEKKLIGHIKGMQQLVPEGERYTLNPEHSVSMHATRSSMTKEEEIRAPERS